MFRLLGFAFRSRGWRSVWTSGVATWRTWPCWWSSRPTTSSPEAQHSASTLAPAQLRPHTPSFFFSLSCFFFHSFDCLFFCYHLWARPAWSSLQANSWSSHHYPPFEQEKMHSNGNKSKINPVKFCSVLCVFQSEMLICSSDAYCMNVHLRAPPLLGLFFFRVESERIVYHWRVTYLLLSVNPWFLYKSWLYMLDSVCLHYRLPCHTIGGQYVKDSLICWAGGVQQTRPGCWPMVVISVL